MSNEANYGIRPRTKVITAAELGQTFINPELIRLQLSKKVKKKPLDVGSLAYFLRGRNASVMDDRGTPVVKSSLIASRQKLVVNLLESFIGRREYSILLSFTRAEYFVNWLNSENYREMFDTHIRAQEAYRDFTAHLNSRIINNEIRPLTAHGYQNTAIQILSFIYPIDYHNILSAATIINAEKGSAPPRDAHVRLYTEVFVAIGQQCGKFVLGFEKYPLVIKFDATEVVVFPSNSGMVSKLNRGSLVYNGPDRRIATAAEYIDAASLRGLKGSYATTAVLRAEKNLVRANGDNRNWHRLYLANLAMKSYAGLLLLMTGATATEFNQFKYADAIEIEKSPIKKELSAIKFRARGKKTYYSIGRGAGLTVLKEYLQLREWILNGSEYDKLFFSISEDGNVGDFDVSVAMIPLQGLVSGIFIDPAIVKLSPRKMRKHKSIVQHTAGLSPETVASALNHTVAMNTAGYADAPTDQQESELQLFWRSMRHAANIVLERSKKLTADTISTPAGHCAEYSKPLKIRDVSNGSIEPNCRTQYGCLHCVHYVCHSDEEDIHKLLSMQYVVNAVRRITPEPAHAESLYRELSMRVEFIMDALGERSENTKKLVADTRQKVYEYGVLTAFWEGRLSRYEKMGVVF